MKLVKYFQGVTSGTYMGRDDGYPETKRVTYDLESDADRVRFVKEFGQEKEETFAQEKPIAMEVVHRHIDLAEKHAQYQQLKKELGL